MATGSPVSPTPSSSAASRGPLLGLRPAELHSELCKAISSGVRSALDALLHAHTTRPDAPPAAAVRSFLSDVAAALQPALTRELDLLHLVTARSVFALPSGVDEGKVRAALEEVRQTHDEAEERGIDEEFAMVRAEIRGVEASRRELQAKRRQVGEHVALLESVQLQAKGTQDGEGEVTAQDAPGGRWHEELGKATRMTEDAEADYVRAVQMLSSAGGVVGEAPLLDAARGALRNKPNSKPLDDHMDEHAPLLCFTQGASVFDSVQGRTVEAEDLAGLRARLMG